MDHGSGGHTKAQRFRIFLHRLGRVEAAKNDEEAFEVLKRILNGVEDEFSGIQFAPENWRTDGRMYPPQRDFRVKSFEEIQAYRSKGHYILFGKNGSIRIQTLNGEIIFDKAGADGKNIAEISS